MKKLLCSIFLLTVLNAETYIDVQKRCSQGNMINCYNLALMYENGEGVKQNFPKATELYTKVCDASNTKDVYLRACYNLGFIYLFGNESGKRKDYIRRHYHKAIQLFSKACNGGDEKGCYQLGIVYSTGDGVKQNDSTAKEYFRKACDLGYNEGCKDYAKIK